MQLLLIRHGESVNNLLYSQTADWSARVPDPPLTPRGERQAELLAQAFAEGRLPRPDVLITSLMRRAVQTAAPLAEALDSPLVGDESVHEVNGVYESTKDAAKPHPGSPASALRAISPRLLLPSDVDESGWYHRQYETDEAAWHRALLVAGQLSGRYGGTDHLVAIVTHGWFSQLLLRAVIGWPARDDGTFEAWFEFNNTGTALIQTPSLTSSRPVDIHWVNRTDHLPLDLLTW